MAKCIKHRMPDGKIMNGPVHGPGQTCVEWDRMKNGGKTSNSKQHSVGGYLIGPSHEAGGIQAIVDGTEPIEVEGGEFVINKPTVDALGEDFLHKLNSTQTPYHEGGFQQGELPPPSYFKRGGRIRNRNTIRKKKNKLNRKIMQNGGPICNPGYEIGPQGQCLPILDVPINIELQSDNRIPLVCPPGQIFENETCVPIIQTSEPTKSVYKRGGKVKKQLGFGDILNKKKKLKKGARLGNLSIKRSGITKGSSNHSHTKEIDPLTGNGIARGTNHNHRIIDNIMQTYCDENGRCHGHST